MTPSARAAQAERILVAGRHLRRCRTCPASASSLSASATACATGAFGQRVAGEARPVVLLDRRRRPPAARRRAARSSGPSVPCSSGNSPTMSVTRSAFASSAARSAARAVGADHRRDVAREEAQPLDALGLRAELVVIDDAARASATRASSGALRSWSKKNLASASRARSTRSLPSTIAAGSRVSRLLTSEEAVRRACRRRRRARSTSGSAASSGSGIPAARRGTRGSNVPA